MNPITDLVDLLIHELKAQYAIESKELNELSHFIRKVDNKELQQILYSRKEQTMNQILRLEEVLVLLGERPTMKLPNFITDFFEETKYVLQYITELSVLEARIILCFQTLAHIEIANYGTLISFAKTLNLNKVVSILEQSLDEEKTCDLKLTILAEYKINEDAKVETFMSPAYDFNA